MCGGHDYSESPVMCTTPSTQVTTAPRNTNGVNLPDAVIVGSVSSVAGILTAVIAVLVVIIIIVAKRSRWKKQTNIINNDTAYSNLAFSNSKLCSAHAMARPI